MDLSEKLQSVLSDPDSMAKIASIAGGLLGENALPSPAEEEKPSLAALPYMKELSLLVGSGSRERKALLSALRPYLKREKQMRLDKILTLLSALEILSSLPPEGGAKCTGEN